MRARHHCDGRATSPVVGVALAVALTVVLASGVAVAFAVGVAPDEPPPSARIGVTVDASTDAVVLQHRGGDAIDVDADRVRIVVTVDGEQLQHQPPVPFFAATGFTSGPTGPFNRGYDGAWTAGETATFALAGTNAPLPEPGDTVTVAIYADDALVARATTTARGETARAVGVAPRARTSGQESGVAGVAGFLRRRLRPRSTRRRPRPRSRRPRGRARAS